MSSGDRSSRFLSAPDSALEVHADSGGRAGIGFEFGWEFEVGVGTFNALVAPTAAKNVAISLTIMKLRI